MAKLIVRGARHHNLKNINVELPKNCLLVISGMSGSGKSTLAFDIIYAEGQRRYVNSLTAYARQFLDIMDKPDVDAMEGLAPAIAIQQKTTSSNKRSTVGTVTEIYDYLRLLYSRVGTPLCHRCKREISSQSVETICDSILKEFAGSDILVLAPRVQHKKGTHTNIIASAISDGYSRIRIDGTIYNLDDDIPPLNRQQWHDIQIVVDRLAAVKAERSRLFESVQTTVDASEGNIMVQSDKKTGLYSQHNSCPYCGITMGELEPRVFSFNSPMGMCNSCTGSGLITDFDPDLIIPDRTKSIREGGLHPFTEETPPPIWDQLNLLCHRHGLDVDTPLKDLTKTQLKHLLYGKKGQTQPTFDVFRRDYTAEGVIGIMRHIVAYSNNHIRTSFKNNYIREAACPACNGARLRPEPLSVHISGKNIVDVCDMSIQECQKFFDNITLNPTQAYIAKDILKEIKSRLEFLDTVGLSYLTLSRRSTTLSGGESQRIRLATQIGSRLTGVLYILDEPTIGLHQRDNSRLIETLKKLRDLGNTVIVVEHDEEVIRSSDWLVDLGPKAGVHGGEVIFEGTVKDMLNDANSITGRYIRGDTRIKIDKKVREHHNELVVQGACQNNLKNIDVKFPLGMLVCVTGVSGSGKSTLINTILYNELKRQLVGGGNKSGLHGKIQGAEDIDNVISIDQSPIGRTPRSNPATYIDAFKPIRDIFVKTQLARSRGYTPGHFSFNVQKGRCAECEGSGLRHIQMQFLADVYVRCDKCRGKRFDSQILQVRYRGKNIYDILDMTVDEAVDFFKNHRAVYTKLHTLQQVGLGYIKLGQSSKTLSGGEAQRVKLASELSKRETGKTIYLLDEPTTGLHFADVDKLLEVLNELVNRGNSVIIIEHNMDVIANADWVIDMGPEGGDEGGTIVAQGTPQHVSQTSTHTGKYLKKMLKVV